MRRRRRIVRQIAGPKEKDWLGKSSNSNSKQRRENRSKWFSEILHLAHACLSSIEVRWKEITDWIKQKQGKEARRSRSVITSNRFSALAISFFPPFTLQMDSSLIYCPELSGQEREIYRDADHLQMATESNRRIRSNEKGEKRNPARFHQHTRILRNWQQNWAGTWRIVHTSGWFMECCRPKQTIINSNKRLLDGDADGDRCGPRCLPSGNGTNSQVWPLQQWTGGWIECKITRMEGSKIGVSCLCMMKSGSYFHSGDSLILII